MHRTLKRIFNKAAAISILILLPFFLSAQSSDLGNWLMYIGSKKIDSKWNLHHEVQYRNYNTIGDLEQLLLRTGIGYNLAESNNNLLLGYGFIRSENYVAGTEEKVTVNEHRIYQQFVTKQKFNRWSWQHRYRLEERFVEKEDFKMRFRYFFSVNFALNPDTESGLLWYLSSYNELFINLDADAFDRNRSYFALGTKINNNLKLELGYMNQFFGGASRDQVNVLALVNF